MATTEELQYARSLDYYKRKYGKGFNRKAFDQVYNKIGEGGSALEAEYDSALKNYQTVDGKSFVTPGGASDPNSATYAYKSPTEISQERVAKSMEGSYFDEKLGRMVGVDDKAYDLASNAPKQTTPEQATPSVSHFSLSKLNLANSRDCPCCFRAYSKPNWLISCSNFWTSRSN